MGVNLKDLLIRREIDLEELQGKTLAVDAFNMLFQFLTTIRAPDGNYLTDSKGRVTSHLIGLFNRTTALLQKNIKLIFVFDGLAPE
ncbi:MAG: flap structure-specific endonuclease, partial [Candidatus Woesearchaeota archaeon]|nr:flap structure-specific endonuclease [Candidatus Woesearchaeota archaeon]